MFTQQYNGKIILRALELYQQLQSFRTVATRLNLSKSSVHRWYHNFSIFRRIGNRFQKKPKRRRKIKYPDIVFDIRQLFETHKTLEILAINVLQEKLFEKYGSKPSITTIRKALKQARISRRRFPTTFKLRNHSEAEHQEKVRIFKEQMNESITSLDQIICLDKTGFCNVGNSVYGYYPRGKIPEFHKHPKRIKRHVAMAITVDGIVHSKAQEKAFSTKTFVEFLKGMIESLSNTNQLSKVKAVLMDNISFHRSIAVRDLLNSHGLRPLFIAPYTPDHNPIEMVFSQLKRVFRMRWIHRGCIENHSDNISKFDEAIVDSIREVQNIKTFQQYYVHSLRKKVI